MGIWFRSRPAPEMRSAATFPPGWLAPPGSYANVDGSVISNAQQSIAIRAAVDLIASVCSELPIDYFTGQGSARKQIRQPGYLDDPAGDGYGLEDWLYQVMYSWLYRGNLYGEELARTGNVRTQMSLFHPDCVTGYVDDQGRVRWSVNGFDAGPREIVHKRVNAVTGQVLGLSPITAAANAIGISLAGTRFGKSFFDSDAQPIGILRNTRAALNTDQAKTVKEKFMAALRGGEREPIVLGAAYEWQQLSVTPEESQFIETIGYSEAQCARIFGPGIAQLLGYETGGSLTYATLQDFDITLLKYSVNKWLRRLERLLFEFLPRPQYAVFNRDALLETSTMQRYLAYASALGSAAWKTVDEVREKENLPPMPETEESPAPPPAPADDDDDEPADGEEDET